MERGGAPILKIEGKYKKELFASIESPGNMSAIKRFCKLNQNHTKRDDPDAV